MSNGVDVDVIKKQKYELLGGKRKELMERSKTNPYLLDVISQYDAFNQDVSKISNKLVDALLLLKQHFMSLMHHYSDDNDMMLILQHDLQMVENAVKKYKNELNKTSK